MDHSYQLKLVFEFALFPLQHVTISYKVNHDQTLTFPKPNDPLQSVWLRGARWPRPKNGGIPPTPHHRRFYSDNMRRKCRHSHPRRERCDSGVGGGRNFAPIRSNKRITSSVKKTQRTSRQATRRSAKKQNTFRAKKHFPRR